MTTNTSYKRSLISSLRSISVLLRGSTLIIVWWLPLYRESHYIYIYIYKYIYNKLSIYIYTYVYLGKWLKKTCLKGFPDPKPLNGLTNQPGTWYPVMQSWCARTKWAKPLRCRNLNPCCFWAPKSRWKHRLPRLDWDGVIFFPVKFMGVKCVRYTYILCVYIYIYVVFSRCCMHFLHANKSLLFVFYSEVHVPQLLELPIQESTWPLAKWKWASKRNM